MEQFEEAEIRTKRVRRLHALPLFATLALCLDVGQATLAHAAGAEPPALTGVRVDEDYSYLRDPKNRSGAWWEPLKYIPLDRTGGRYLTLGDEHRLRYERFGNNEWGAGRRPDESYWRYRMLPYADLRLGPRLRLFGQLQGAWSSRSEDLKNPFTDETGLDLVQGFGEYRIALSGQSVLTLRAGRQVLEYGAQRLISSGPNIRQACDGALVRWEQRGWKLDAFAMRPVLPDFDWFDDAADNRRKVWALYATRAPLDLYFIGFRNDAARYAQGSGRERRYTLGARYFGASGPRSWDIEANVQAGDFNGADIRAGSLDTAFRYTFLRARYRPYVELRANVISGDGDSRKPRLNSFNPMFPTSQYFGDVGQLGPVNLVNLRPNFGLDLGGGWKLSGALTFFWRQSVEDGIYGPGLNLVRSGAGSRARYIGTQGDAALDWAANRNLSLRFVYGAFEPGRFIEETGPAQTVHFVQANVVFKY